MKKPAIPFFRISYKRGAIQKKKSDPQKEEPSKGSSNKTV